MPTGSRWNHPQGWFSFDKQPREVSREKARAERAPKIKTRWATIAGGPKPRYRVARLAPHGPEHCQEDAARREQFSDRSQHTQRLAATKLLRPLPGLRKGAPSRGQRSARAGRPRGPCLPLASPPRITRSELIPEWTNAGDQPARMLKATRSAHAGAPRISAPAASDLRSGRSSHFVSVKVHVFENRDPHLNRRLGEPRRGPRRGRAC